MLIIIINLINFQKAYKYYIFILFYIRSENFATEPL